MRFFNEILDIEITNLARDIQNRKIFGYRVEKRLFLFPKFKNVTRLNYEKRGMQILDYFIYKLVWGDGVKFFL